MSDETHQSGKLPAISEVAIVVGIIGVMGIAMAPAFVKTRQYPREKAQQVACLSNLKQLDLGLLQYVQDYDETLCYNDEYPGGGAPTDVSWRGLISPYVKSTGVFICPSNPSSGIPNYFGDTFGQSYGANGYPGSNLYSQTNGNNAAVPAGVVPFPSWFSTTDGTNPTPVTPLASIGSPSRLIMVAETTYGWPDMGWGIDASCSPFPPTKSTDCWNSPGIFAGHSGIGNFLFADGHVKAMKLANTLTPVNLWDIPDIESNTAAPTAAQTYASNVQKYWDLQ